MWQCHLPVIQSGGVTGKDHNLPRPVLIREPLQRSRGQTAEPIVNVCQHLQALSKGSQRGVLPTAPLPQASLPSPPIPFTPCPSRPETDHSPPQNSEVGCQSLQQTASLTAGMPPGESSEGGPCMHNRTQGPSLLVPHAHTVHDAITPTYSRVVRTGTGSSDCGWSWGQR